nr:hypothetical protein [Tanacetum cinerariifolium]
MGKPLPPDRIFDFPMHKPEPHPAYDFFAPETLLGYAGNPNNNNGLIEADVQLLGEPELSDDDSEGFKDDEEVWEVNEEWLMAPVTPPPTQVVPSPSTYELVKKVIQVSDAEVADGYAIGEISLRVSTVEGQVQVMVSQLVQAIGRLELVGTQMEQGQQAVTQRDETIEGLN